MEMKFRVLRMMNIRVVWQGPELQVRSGNGIIVAGRNRTTEDSRHMALEIVVGKKKDMLRVSLIGRLVDIDVKKFSKKMENVYKEKVGRIVLDVSRLNFINSHGLGVIVYYHTAMQREGRELIVLNGNPNPQAYINRLMELTNLNAVMNVIRSPRELKTMAGKT